MVWRKHKVNKKSFFNRPVWRNSVGNITAHPVQYYEPENLQDLLAIVNEAKRMKLQVRAVGAGHSFSYAPHTHGLLVDTSLLSKNLGPYSYTSQEGKYIEFEAGITLKKMNHELDKLHLSISTMGGIDHMALAGAVQTGTHGSNLALGAISELVKSIVLVTNDFTKEEAKAYRIEKSDGFTDKQSYPVDAPQLIQDDDVFNSVIVSFGSMGIIYALVIEVEPLFFLEERKGVYDWEQVKAQLKQGVFYQHRSVFVLLNPYQVKGERLALLAWQDKVEAKSKARLMWEDFKRSFLYRIDKAVRNPITQLLGNLPLTYWLFVWLINRFPKQVPKLINRSIKSQKDKTYVNKSYKVMHQGLDYLKERGYDAEFAIALQEDQYLTLLDELLKLLEDLHTQYQLQLPAPIELRFVKASEVFLTPEYGKDICYIDTAVIKHAYGNEALLYHIQKLFMKYRARPHWGKINEQVDKQYIEKIYPKFDDWMVQFNRFNKNGIFSNRFTKQMVE